ncbi:MAG: tyrosine--tRNA ligase [Pseudomonadota bacterium]
MKNILDLLKQRGFIDKTTDDEGVRLLLDTPAACYIGFDPTASSLHVGSLVPIMALAHMERAGHKAIALVGGGTGLVGDPSGKTEMRQLLSLENIKNNINGIKTQLSSFLDFKEKSLLVNNAEWLLDLNYIDFLRNIGRHFSVNRMLAAESYKIRLETGLNFREFNYMLLQAYDFLRMYEKHQCRLQMGGSDQWGNIVAGIELIRRSAQGDAFGITFPLITTSTGAKMGKTAHGAVWLDPARTSPYDYYQFWINTEDADVPRFLALFTFLPINEVEDTSRLKDSDINAAKAVLAYEATALVHGEAEAAKALIAAGIVFGHKEIPAAILPSSGIHGESEEIDLSGVPATKIATDRLMQGIPAFKLFHEVGLCSSGGAARRLIEQGGGYVAGIRIEKADLLISDKHIQNGQILLRAGKKKYHHVEPV